MPDSLFYSNKTPFIKLIEINFNDIIEVDNYKIKYLVLLSLYFHYILLVG